MRSSKVEVWWVLGLGQAVEGVPQAKRLSAHAKMTAVINTAATAALALSIVLTCLSVGSITMCCCWKDAENSLAFAGELAESNRKW